MVKIFEKSQNFEQKSEKIRKMQTFLNVYFWKKMTIFEKLKNLVNLKKKIKFFEKKRENLKIAEICKLFEN